MNKERKEIVEEFISVLNNTSAQKFLRATPYTKTDGVDYSGAVSEELFFDFFYVETEESKGEIRRILSTLKNSPEATIIIRGYSGCGKTSFLHDLLFRNIKKATVIDCEKGIDNQDKDPILTKITFHLVEIINEDIITNQARTLRKVKEVFYDNYMNSMIIGRFLDGGMLSHKFLTHFFEDRKFDDTLTRIYHGDECAKGDLARCILAYLEALHGMQRLFVLVAWDICSHLVAGSSKVENIFCIDNLDNVESDKIKVFLKYYTQFWFNLVHAFSEFDLQKWSIPKYSLVQNYAFILVVRETTYAKLTEHFSGREKGVVEEVDADQIYSDCNVYSKRNKFLVDHKDEIPHELLNEATQINALLENDYIRKSLLALFNYDNNTAIKTLCVVQENMPKRFEEYKKVAAEVTDLRAALGVVLFSVLCHFRDRGYFDNYLMLYNFKHRTENQQYKFSATRLLLTYLSNYREPISLFNVFTYFSGVIDPNDIAEILYNIYQLRFSEWRHLITFTDSPPIDYRWINRQTNLYENVHEDNEAAYSKLQITDAGRAYLKNVVPHFEFFSVRVENKVPLFSSRIIGTDYHIQKYISIIDRVFNNVKECNRRIVDTVNDICKKRDWTYEDFKASKFMYINPVTGKRQFHGERIIFTHIGYINAYRKYVISQGNILVETRASINKSLAEAIKKYLCLYSSSDCIRSGTNDAVKKILWEQTLKVVDNSKDFTLTIEVETEE